MTRSRRPWQRWGAASVEFALTAPVALLITYASIELSRVCMLMNTVNNAALEGCREATLPGGTASKATATAQNVLAAIGAQSGVVTVTPSTITDTTTAVTVRVDLPMDANAWIAGMYFGGRQLSSTCKLSREWIITSGTGS